MSKKIAILYHSGCTDGFGGAYAAWKKFQNKASYYPVEYQTPPPQEVVNKEVYLIDFSYKKDVLQELKSKNKRVIVLEHHKSAESEITVVDEYILDLNHSGATIAWRYFFGENKKIPTLLSYIEDNDLWRFKLKKSKAVFAALSTVPFEFDIWDKIVKNFERLEYRKKFITKGENIISYQESIIQRLLSRATPVIFENYKILAVNSPLLGSEVGNRLAQINPPFSIVWSVSKNKINVSLRSIGDFDVSLLAQKYGGGGHLNAAGFSLEITDNLPWKNETPKNNC